LELGLIEEGELLKAVNDDLKAAHQAIAAYMEEHGDRAEGAKAEMNLKITFKVENVDTGMVSIKGTTKVVSPTRPASVSMAMSEEDDEGFMGLFVKKSGSEAASPRQGSLCTQAGEAVDSETGEVLKP